MNRPCSQTSSDWAKYGLAGARFNRLSDTAKLSNMPTLQTRLGRGNSASPTNNAKPMPNTA